MLLLVIDRECPFGNNTTLKQGAFVAVRLDDIINGELRFLVDANRHGIDTSNVPSNTMAPTRVFMDVDEVLKLASSGRTVDIDLPC